MINIGIIVQGEGLGHITQALTLIEWYTDHPSIKCSCVLVGTSNKDLSIPNLFYKKESDLAIIPFFSPGLIYTKGNRLSLIKSTTSSFLNINRIYRSCHAIDEALDLYMVDCIVNLYDTVGGIYNYFYNTQKRTFISIAHQYYLLHRSFQHPEKFSFNRFALITHSYITSLRSNRRFALSFNEISEDDDKRKITVIPPLIRNEIKQLPHSTEGEIILAYANQSYLVSEYLDWHEKYNKKLALHCFAKTTYKEKVALSSNFMLHPVDRNEFMFFLSKAKFIITSAGFETICEALYLNKPVVTIPLNNHYEQICNAKDAKDAGVGISVNSIYDLGNDVPTLSRELSFRSWANTAKSLLTSGIIGVHKEKEPSSRLAIVVQNSLILLVKFFNVSFKFVKKIA